MATLANQLAALRQPSSMLPPPSVAPLDNSPAPVLPASVLPNVVGPSPSPLMLDTAKRDQMASSGSGISQIKNPILRGLANAADIAGSVFAPRLDSLIPGTQGHHQLLMHQQNALIGQDQAQQAADTAQQDAQAQIRLRDSQASKAAAQSDAMAPVTITPEQAAAVGFPEIAGHEVSPKTLAALMVGKQRTDAQVQVGAGHDTTAQTVAQGHDVTNTAVGAAHDATRVQTTGMTDQNRLQTTGMRDNTSSANTAARLTNPAGHSVGGSGDAAIASLPPSMQQLIKSTAAGDIAMPPAGSRAPGAQALRQAVINYDPTYTDARYKGKQQFKTGGDADKLVSLATALSHAQAAVDHSNQLGFAPGLPFNASAADSAYTKDAQFVTGELGKLVEGKALTQGEYEEHIKGLNSVRPEVRNAALNESLNLLNGKVKGIFQKYKASTGETLPVDKFLDPETAARLQHINASESGGGSSSSGLSVSLKDALALPQNAGKSEAQVRADIQAHGHAVRP